MSFQEKIIEGKYNYYQGDQVYCEENFSVYKEDGSQGRLIFNAELTSRVETGEFLKVIVDYKLSKKFEPLNLKVKRLLGGNKSVERYVVDLKDKNVRYTFRGTDGIHETEKIITGKFHIAAPAFSTSMLATAAKKLDPVHRTSYNIISSNNVWEYEGPFKESEIFIELSSLEPVPVHVGDTELNATHCKIFEDDKAKNPNITGYSVYLSKHYQIPYKASFADDIQIEVQNLKNYETEYKDLF